MPGVFGGAAALAGVVTLIGWSTARPSLSDISLGADAPMNPISALLFIMLGAALISAPKARAAIRRRMTTSIGGVIAFLGALRLADLILRLSIPFDRVFSWAWTDRQGALARSAMTGMTAFDFCLIGCGLASILSGRRATARMGQWIAIAGLILPTAMLIGYLYQSLGLYEIVLPIPMPFPTSAVLVVAAIGILSLRPRLGVVGVLTAPNLGGTVARRLFCAVIALPPLLGFVCIEAASRLPIDISGAAGLLVTLTGMPLAIAILIGAHHLERTAEALGERGRELEIARREAESANRTKSEFLASMSHELRTPMNAVIGFSEIMRDARFGPLAERYREYADDIFNSGVHLLSVINQILDLAKIEARQLVLSEDDVALSKTAQICLSFVKESASKGGVKLVLDLPAKPLMVRGDETRLRQIVLNLLSNAVKFTGAGGTVTLGARTTPDGGCEVSVADTGIGMNAEELALAFMPFRQVDSSMSRRYEGTGLGLPLAKALAEQHGGALAIESRPGIGTTARVWLPPWRCAENLEYRPTQKAAAV